MRKGLSSSRLGKWAFLAVLMGMEMIGGAKTPYLEDGEEKKEYIYTRVKRKSTLHTFSRSMGRVLYRITLT